MSVAPANPPADKAINPAPKDLTHAWIGAAEIPLSDAAASKADLRLQIKEKDLEPNYRIDVLEVYCRLCKLPMSKAKLDPCSAKIDNQHLIGGDQRERVKRKTFNPPPGAAVTRVPGPKINRYGIDAVIRGEL